MGKGASRRAKERGRRPALRHQGPDGRPNRRDATRCSWTRTDDVTVDKRSLIPRQVCRRKAISPRPERPEKSAVIGRHARHLQTSFFQALIDCTVLDWSISTLLGQGTEESAESPHREYPHQAWEFSRCAIERQEFRPSASITGVGLPSLGASTKFVLDVHVPVRGQPLNRKARVRGG
jgi:hypothetical protein